MKKNKVWVVDDDEAIRWVLEKTLSTQSLESRIFSDAHSVLESLTIDTPDVLISDIKMPQMDGLTLLEKIKQTHPHLPIIIMTAHSDLDTTVNAYQVGAFDYLPKPFDIEQVIDLIEKAVKQKTPNLKAKNAPTKTSSISKPYEIIGDAPMMQELYRTIGRLSRTSISVLLNGESGTGKELVAKALHRHSPRSSSPFIAINMAAIPKDLIEAELFGHEKGAFTGATSNRAGRFEQAHNGTLFLDEIGDMPLDVQTRLLRVLADGEFYRIGGHQLLRVNVRIIAATHQNLDELVQKGLFREDLFHRLNVIRLPIPPLRERTEDIAELSDYFLQQASEELDIGKKNLSPEVLALMTNYSWPGNVRQLENLCQHVTVMANADVVFIDDLPSELLTAKPLIEPSHSLKNKSVPPQAMEPASWEDQLRDWAKIKLNNNAEQLYTLSLEKFEKILIESTLEHTNGHKQKAAKILGLGRNTLTRKSKEYKSKQTNE